MKPAWPQAVDDHPSFQLDDRTSITIAAYGNAKATQRCIEALFRSVHGDYELLLVNDNSPDEGATARAFEWASSIHQNTKIYETVKNIEYSGSVNIALSQAKGENIFFISNDIYVTPYYFKAILEAAKESHLNGILRGSSNFVDNGLTSHNISFSKDTINLDSLFDCGSELYNFLAGAVASDPFLVGDAFMVSRSLIKRIGVLDPLFYGYFADSDFGLRAQIAGFNLLLVPSAYAYHDRDTNFNYLPPEERNAKSNRRWEKVYENWARFKMKYELPVELRYSSLHDIPWQTLGSAPFSRKLHYFEPADSSPHRIH